MLDVVILAAGMGTRMKSQLPKVLHPVAGRPMIQEVMATARELSPQHTVIVVGHGAEAVQAVVGEDASYALQSPQLGTGHAVMQAASALRLSDADTVVVLYGDTPLIRSETLSRAAAHHREAGAAITLLSFLPDDPTGYGRIVRDEQGFVRAIVEQKAASESERAIRESNSGIMVFEAPWIWNSLGQLSLSPQGEYYLTDMVALAVEQGRTVEALVIDEREVLGINDRAQLAAASQLLWEQRRQHWLLSGVTLVDPKATWIDADVRIGQDTVIHPNVVLRGATSIGQGCEIGPHTVLDDATIGDRCRITQSQIASSTLEAGARVGPFAYVRSGAVLEANTLVGAGAEVARSRVGEGSMMSHFGFLGDAEIGAGVNIGAGTVTCNYDGAGKHATVVGDNAFIGSDTLLVAPVSVGPRARTGAGSVVTRDVAEAETVIGVPARPTR